MLVAETAARAGNRVLAPPQVLPFRAGAHLAMDGSFISTSLDSCGPHGCGFGSTGRRHDRNPPPRSRTPGNGPTRKPRGPPNSRMRGDSLIAHRVGWVGWQPAFFDVLIG